MVFIKIVALFNIADGDYAKPRRTYGGVTGLTPFPRIGRSDPDQMNWDNAAYSSLEDYEGNQIYNHKNYKKHFICNYTIHRISTYGN